MAIDIVVTSVDHFQYAEKICSIIVEAAKKRGTGIAKRTPEYIREKMEQGKAVIALEKHVVAGFCYIESWGGKQYVAHSGLIVAPEFQGKGLAKKIKKEIFKLSQKLYPNAKIFGITTSLAVMKINSNLGYKPVTFSELTDDEAFWKGCQGCVNYDILQRTNRSHCLCTGMLHIPETEVKKQDEGEKSERWGKFKRFMKYKKIKVKRKLLSVVL